jgi:hypothetical protein
MVAVEAGIMALSNISEGVSGEISLGCNQRRSDKAWA